MWLPNQDGEGITSWSRRGFLGAVVLAGCRRQPRRRSPNILFAIADDHSWPHAGAYGDPVVKTPAFDRVAREGVLFRNSFCCAPSCTPSRSTVLTGRPLWEVGEGGLLYGTLPSSYPLFTHQLEDAGYHTGYTGKGWGPGDWRAGGLTRNPTGAEYNSRLLAAPPGIDTRDYAGNFEDFLAGRRPGQPFCFWYGGTEPHRIYGKNSGLQAGKRLEAVRVPEYWPDTPEIRADILDYYQEIEWFDSHLGRMMARLEKTGELDDTLIVVTSDNGMPFPRAKVNLYDGGVRMPLAIRWPAAVPGGRVVEEMVSHADFAPTFLEAAGIAKQEMTTGRSLLPMLTASRAGPVIPEFDYVITALERHTWCRPDGATYPMRAIRTRQFLYICNFEPDRWPTGGPDFVSSNKTLHGDVDGCPTKDFLLDTGNRKRFPRQFEMCFGKRPAEELYELASDPDQVNNLAGAAAFQEVKRAHRERLEARLKQTGDPRIEGRDPWQGYVYRQTSGFGAVFNRSLPEQDRQKAGGGGAHKPE
ncbi:MAG: sulfatase [Acidimicrobiia bacterium]|nr:sulfatase [Acidimicrobiia bacterium]